MQRYFLNLNQGTHMSVIEGSVQNSFIPGRHLHDNIIILQEVIHSINLKSESSGWMILILVVG